MDVAARNTQQKHKKASGSCTKTAHESNSNVAAISPTLPCVALIGAKRADDDSARGVRGGMRLQHWRRLMIVARLCCSALGGRVLLRRGCGGGRAAAPRAREYGGRYNVG